MSNIKMTEEEWNRAVEAAEITLKEIRRVNAVENMLLFWDKLDETPAGLSFKIRWLEFNPYTLSMI